MVKLNDDGDFSPAAVRRALVPDLVTLKNTEHMFYKKLDFLTI